MSGIFEQNHRLTPLDKCQFFDHEMTFLPSKKTHFENITSSDEKPRLKEIWNTNFNQNHWLTLLEKCKFFDYSKMTFMSSNKPQHHQAIKTRSLIPKSWLERHFEFFTRIMG